MMSLRMKISPPVRLTWKPGLIGERLAQRVERQLLAPLAFDVQQVADVAELAVQVAPHRRFVDGAHRQPIGAAGLLVEEPLDPPLVSAAPDTRPRMARQAAAPARASRSSRAARSSRVPNVGKQQIADSQWETRLSDNGAGPDIVAF